MSASDRDVAFKPAKIRETIQRVFILALEDQRAPEQVSCSRGHQFEVDRGDLVVAVSLWFEQAIDIAIDRIHHVGLSLSRRSRVKMGCIVVTHPSWLAKIALEARRSRGTDISH